MNTDLMLNIAKQTLENMDVTKVKRVDLNSLEYPDGSPVYTITIIMQKPEAELPTLDEPTEAADEPVIPEAADEANGEQ